jgi:hypothetical protein
MTTETFTGWESVKLSIVPTAAVNAREPNRTPVSESTGGGFAPDATTAVGAEVAEAEPVALDAVTRTRKAWPMSAPTTVYVADEAPTMSAQAAPLALHRSHW